MSKLFSGRRLGDAAFCAALAVMLVFLVIWPADCVEAAKSGVTLCLNVIVPSLFPFFVLSSLTVRLGYADALGQLLEPVMRPLFGVGGACSSALILGYIGGYPTGAKTVIELYENGSCTRSEAERLLAFCNNSGPAFILGVVGSGIFSDSRAGLLLCLAHVLSSLLIGILFGLGRRGTAAASAGRKRPRAQSAASAFTDAVISSFSSSLNICGFVIFFTVFIKMLFLSGVIPAAASVIGYLLSPLGIDKVWAERLITGMIEISSGVWTLRDASGHMTASMAMAAFMLGWAGMSVHFQVLSFLNGSGLAARAYISGKLLHGVLAAALTALLCKVFRFSAPAALLMAERVGEIADLSFFPTAVYSLSCAVCVFALHFAASKKRLR